MQSEFIYKQRSRLTGNSYFPEYMLSVLRRHLDDIKKYVPQFVPEFISEFIPEFVPEFDLNTDFYSGTNSGMNSAMNFFMSSKLRLNNKCDFVNISANKDAK